MVFFIRRPKIILGEALWVFLDTSLDMERLNMIMECFIRCNVSFFCQFK